MRNGRKKVVKLIAVKRKKCWKRNFTKLKTNCRNENVLKTCIRVLKDKKNNKPFSNISLKVQTVYNERNLVIRSKPNKEIRPAIKLHVLWTEKIGNFNAFQIINTSFRRFESSYLIVDRSTANEVGNVLRNDRPERPWVLTCLDFFDLVLIEYILDFLLDLHLSFIQIYNLILQLNLPVTLRVNNTASLFSNIRHMNSVYLVEALSLIVLHFSENYPWKSFSLFQLFSPHSVLSHYNVIHLCKTISLT